MSSSSGPGLLGHLVSRREERLYRPAGDVFHSSGATCLPVQIGRQHCGVDERQHLVGGIYQQNEGEQFLPLCTSLPNRS